MIKGMRSAIICREAFQDEGGAVTIRDVHGFSIRSANEPGIEQLHLFVDIESDGRECIYEVQIQCQGLDMRIPARVPDGWRLISGTFPMLIPFLEVGPLTVSVRDIDHPSKVWSCEWVLGFAAAAKQRADHVEAGADIRRAAADWAKQMNDAGRVLAGL